jgi:ribonucrease Y
VIDMWRIVAAAFIGWIIGNYTRYSVAKYSAERLIDEAQKQAEEKAIEMVNDARRWADIESQRRLQSATQKEADLRKLQRQLGDLNYDLQQRNQELQKRENLVAGKERDIEKSRGKIRRVKDRLNKTGRIKTENA